MNMYEYINLKYSTIFNFSLYTEFQLILKLRFIVWHYEKVEFKSGISLLNSSKRRQVHQKKKSSCQLWDARKSLGCFQSELTWICMKKKCIEYSILHVCLSHPRRYLNLTITANSPVKKQDGARVFQSVATNIIGTDLAFDFLYTNLAEIAA